MKQERGCSVSPYIVIIDDDEAVRSALQRLLRCAHHKVDAYGSGREFFEDLDRHTPDCLLLDVQMPETSGLQVLQHLYAIGASVPVVMVTGQDEAGSQEACLAAGASSYLRKPLDLSVLLEAITCAISSFAERDRLGARGIGASPQRPRSSQSELVGASRLAQSAGRAGEGETAVAAGFASRSS
jgi:FixJ family two-component response regulator